MRLVMTHARRFQTVMMHVQLSAAVLDDGRFVASASSAPSRIAATVADSSIATTASLSAGTSRCNSAPSDAWAENSFRSPSANTAGFVAGALVSLPFAYCPGVDFSEELNDLDWGSWEAHSRTAQVSEGIALLSEAPSFRFTFFGRGFKNSLR